MNVKDWHTYHVAHSRVIVHNQYGDNIPRNIPSALELEQQGSNLSPDDFTDMYNGRPGRKPFEKAPNISCPSCPKNTIYHKLEKYGPRIGHYIGPHFAGNLNPKEYSLFANGPIFILLNIRPGAPLGWNVEINIGVVNTGGFSIGKHSKVTFNKPSLSPANVVIPFNADGSLLIIDTSGINIIQVVNTDESKRQTGTK